ncbi:5-(carboxyamino)imidazole ribonucleotide mutase [bacterium]|nr:5-(carboxyamino)imidazole ribonucleotide mutase [Actinomycetota bacterium]MBE33361.1 5-(carboxyamino)imidazole ribonucleotide mutase [bacterium]|tara:strand:- start:10353 stop:10796 length:444 start_codon:yes stop_codon:yes gene_type:complete
MANVMIMMGSKSDMEIMKKAQDLLSSYDIKSTIEVASAHRNPERVHNIAKDVEDNYDIVIAGAGMAAHLAGVMASLVTKPVIGVPINASLNGLDSLLSVSQMPPGIPVATVAINGSKNAAILAMEILALSNADIKQKLISLRNDFNK